MLDKQIQTLRCSALNNTKLYGYVAYIKENSIIKCNNNIPIDTYDKINKNTRYWTS